MPTKNVPHQAPMRLHSASFSPHVSGVLTCHATEVIPAIALNIILFTCVRDYWHALELIHLCLLSRIHSICCIREKPPSNLIVDTCLNPWSISAQHLWCNQHSHWSQSWGALAISVPENLCAYCVSVLNCPGVSSMGIVSVVKPFTSPAATSARATDPADTNNMLALGLTSGSCLLPWTYCLGSTAKMFVCPAESSSRYPRPARWLVLKLKRGPSCWLLPSSARTATLRRACLDLQVCMHSCCGQLATSLLAC